MTTPAVLIQNEEVDLDGDGQFDTVRAYAMGLFDVPFYVDISLSASGKEFHVPIKLTCLDSFNRLYIADMTGDGKPEIVFPDLGGTDTRGQIYPLMLILHEDTVQQCPVFGEGFFAADSITFQFDTSKVNLNAGHAVLNIHSYASNMEYEMDCSDALLQYSLVAGDSYRGLFASAYTIGGEVVELADGARVICVRTYIEVEAEHELGEGALWLGRYRISSMLQYNGGTWSVVGETFERFED